MRLLCLRLPSNKTHPPNQHCFISSCLSLFFTLVVLLIDASSLAEQLALGCTTLDSYRAGLAHRGGIVLIRKGSITQHWSSAGESRFTFLCWICLCLVVSFRGLCGLHGVKSLVAVSVNRGYSLSAGTRCAPSRTRSKPTPPASLGLATSLSLLPASIRDFTSRQPIPVFLHLSRRARLCPDGAINSCPPPFVHARSVSSAQS
jgi:hypothetical protein